MKISGGNVFSVPTTTTTGLMNRGADPAKRNTDLFQIQSGGMFVGKTGDPDPAGAGSFRATAAAPYVVGAWSTATYTEALAAAGRGNDFTQADSQGCRIVLDPPL
jgi:hypothetical protein